MDAYKERIQKLFCVPLTDFEKIPENSVIRAAFIIDTVQVKVSTKTQKKFAILTISDWNEKFEIPIWNAMFEEKGMLIQENQIVFALIQTEKREGRLSLSCRYIEDINLMDQAKIQECDLLYDKYKMQAKSEPKWKKEKQKVKDEKEEIKKVTLHLDAEKTKLSHIVTLKNLLRSHPGKSTVEIQFLSKKKKVGTLSIGEPWGVHANKAFDEKIHSFKKNLEE